MDCVAVDVTHQSLPHTVPVQFRLDGEHVFAEILGSTGLYAVGHSEELALRRLARKYWTYVEQIAAMSAPASP